MKSHTNLRASRIQVGVRGARLSALMVGNPKHTPVLLLHGLAAHNGWFERCAEAMQNEFLVVAPDLSGHGESEHRDYYSGPLWAREIEELMDQISTRDDWVVVGHSMGGAIGARLIRPLRALIIADTQLTPLPDLPTFRYPTRHWKYRSAEEFINHFRVWPGDTLTENLRANLARRGMRAVGNRYCHCFDPKIFAARDRNLAVTELAGVPHTIALLRGEHSVVLTPSAFTQAQQVANVVLTTEVRDAGHHLVATHPGALLRVVHTLKDKRPHPEGQSWNKIASVSLFASST